MDSWILQARKLLEPLRGRPSLGGETTLDRLVGEEASVGEASTRLTACFGFVLRLGRALLSFGLPAQRVEEALGRVAQVLGLEIDCLATPTSLMVSATDGKGRRTRLARVEPGETDLERLTALHALVGRVERGELGPADAGDRIRRLLARAPRYHEALIVLGYGLASAASAVLLGGDAIDSAAALALGTTVGVVARLAHRVATLGRILPALAALVSTLLARLIAASGAPVHEPVLVLASVIVLLPGFTLTVATMELASAHVVSGTARLVGGFSTLVQLGFGVALGHRVAQLVPAPSVAPALDSPEHVVLLAYAAAAVAFTILLRAAPRDAPWILLGAAVSVAGARLGRAWLGPELGAFLGAICIGLVSHLHARLKDGPVLLLLTPGILMLVPGSLGFLSVASMLEADVVSALQTAFRMILVATSLAAGVLVATVAIPPRRAL